jgi:hypothetical protein
MMTNANWGELAPMLDELAALGVEPPETTRKVQAAMGVLADEGRFLHAAPATLAHLSPESLWEALDRVTFLREHEMARRNVRGDFQSVLAAEASADLTAHTDDLINQLRPGFDDASKVIVAAHKAGIRATHTDSAILRLGHEALDAWKAMPEAINALDAVASARLRLSRVTGQLPDADQQAAAFCSAAGVWLDRTVHNRWLALVDHGGPKLNTDAETRVACQRPHRAPIPQEIPMNVDQQTLRDILGTPRPVVR